MYKLRSLFTPLILLLVLLSPALSYADDNTAAAAQQEDAAPKVNPAVELPKMQKILDKIKGQVSGIPMRASSTSLMKWRWSFQVMQKPLARH